MTDEIQGIIIEALWCGVSIEEVREAVETAIANVTKQKEEKNV